MSVSSRRQFLLGGAGVAACMLSRPARGDEAAWADERSYGPFRSKAAFPLSELDGFFHELSRLEQELHRTLAVPTTEENIEIFLLADEASHQRYLSELYPRAPYRRALYVQRGGRGAVYAYRHPELEIDLRHECTHALLHAKLAMVPMWLDEGLAEYFEMPESQRAFAHPHLATLRWQLRLGMVRSIESLEEDLELRDMGPAEYRYAWAWVHFMLHGPLAAHRILVDYLAELRRGRDAGPLSRRLRRWAPDVEQRLVQHFQHWQRKTA